MKLWIGKKTTLSATERKARKELENEKKLQQEAELINSIQAPDEVIQFSYKKRAIPQF